MAKSVLIIGGGVVGCCTAYEAMRRGHDVTLVERGAPDHDGCSLGNAGMIVPSHFVPLAAPGMVLQGLRMLPDPGSPFAIRPRSSRDLMRWGWLFTRAATEERVAAAAPLLRDLNLESRRLYGELESELGGFGLSTTGLFMLCRTEHGLREETETARMAHALGLPAEVMTPEEAACLEPDLAMDIAGAVFYPRDAHLNPGAFMARITHALKDGGACLRYNTDVLGFEHRDGLINSVRVAGGTLEADEVILAAGSWSAGLAKCLGFRMPLQPGKGYGMTVPHPPQPMRACAILTEARVAVTPMASMLRVAGTLEVGGSGKSVSPRRVARIKASVPDYFPAFNEDHFAGAPVWVGLRPCSPDGLPYVGRPTAFRNLLVGAGHAMMGMSVGPVTGRILAELLSGGTPSLNIGLLRPDRYA